MKVYFIGAGPGAADLITVRGQRLIERCPVILYAGSLVPTEVLDCARDDARVVDSAALNLDEILGEIRAAHESDEDVARVHSGDPSLYGAIAEQMRRLDTLSIDYEIVPGVPAFAAAAAALKTELTLPGVSQTVVLTRTAMRSSAMPNKEDLQTLGASGATLAIHLSIRNLRAVCEALLPNYGEDCPVAIVYRVTWPDEHIVRGTLGTIRELVRGQRIRRTALILVGPVLGENNFADSKLYDAEHFHLLRTKKDSLNKSAG